MKQPEELVLERYFELLDSGEIRLKGTRIGIEIVLRDYLEGTSPEEIMLRYPTLSLEQVHAAILYYLHNTEKLDRYLKAWIDEGEAAWQKQQRHPSKFVQALRKRIEMQRRHLQKQLPMLAELASAQ